MKKKKPEFTSKTKKTLAERVNYLCSEPNCQNPTAGPHTEEDKSLITGDAAHICGARPGSARYDPGMTNEERSNVKNGIWLCKSCHDKVDKDWKPYPTSTLHTWKNQAENHAKLTQNKHSNQKLSSISNSISKITKVWHHETTNDHTYIPRLKILKSLNSWINDDKVRTISITGMGGTGKTSLVGNWLKESNSEITREFKGLFYWSFYVDRNIDNFLQKIISFTEKVSVQQLEQEDIDLITKFERISINAPPLIIVLDGLEVLQHALSQGKSYGSFVDAKLRDLILCISHIKKGWICIITSRFPISDLRKSLANRHLQLGRLEVNEAEQLLNRNHVLGPEFERNIIAEFLECHPLILRLFAATLPKNIKHNPKAHLDSLFNDFNTDTEFKAKLDRLLNYYLTVISESQKAIIHALSLFRSPIPFETIEIVCRTLVSSETEVDKSTILYELGIINTSGILLRDEIQDSILYSCHPIIRDFFRSDLYSGGENSGLDAVNLLIEKPDNLKFYGVSFLENIILAIESLVELRMFEQAIELYVTRLNKGKVFLEHGLPHEGKRIFDIFTKDEVARNLRNLTQYPRYNLQQLDIGSFLIGAAEFNIELGEFVDAKSTLDEAILKLDNNRKTDAFRNLARLEYTLGNFKESLNYSSRAINSIGSGLIRGTRAYKYAMALYYQIRTKSILNDIRGANKDLSILENLRSELDIADVWILIPLSKLWINIRVNGYPSCAKLARESLKSINDLSVLFLKIEAKLLIAHTYTILNKFDLALPLINSAYDESVKHSFSAKVWRAMILREYVKLRENKQASASRLTEAFELASGSEMKGIQAEALWCLQFVTSDESERESYRNQAIEIANLCGYVDIQSKYPVS